MSQAAIEGATGPEPSIEKAGDVGEFNINEFQENACSFDDTVANLKAFKTNIKPTIQEFKEYYSDLPLNVFKEGKEILTGGSEKLVSFLKDKLKKVSEIKKSQEDELLF